MHRPSSRYSHQRWAATAAVSVLAAWCACASAVTQLKREAAAPDIALKDLQGADVATAKLRGRIVVVVFGELYHDKTRQGCQQIVAILKDQRFVKAPITPLLVTAHDPRPEDAEAAAQLGITVVRDPARQAFGAYQVTVIPSVVVIDREGKVIHAWAGLTDRFGDLTTDCLLYGTGQLSAEKFQESLNPKPTTAPTEEMRADRLALLARQLARRGLPDMAVEKYAEALKLDPHHTPAHLELGWLLLKQNRLQECEGHFRAVLAEQPAAVQGSLGLAYVQTLRGGGELIEAERRVREVLARNPSHAQAHYLLGLIQEQRGKTEDASSSFKKAAGLLLERAEQE